MSSVAHLKDKYSSPFYKKQAAFLTAFTKSLTSSKPSTIARRRKDLSVTKPGKYLKLAHPKKEPPLPPKPPYVPQRLQQLIRAQDEHGRWKPTRDVLEALGGYVPDPPDGMEPTRWVSALVLVFFKRHPEYWFATDKAYDAGEQYVGDDRLLRTAAQALPPGFADRPGSYNARLDREAVLQGRWKESEQALLKTVGYMGFVPDAGAGAGGSSSSSSLSGAELSGGIGDVFSDFSKANASPRSNEEFSAYTEIAATIAKHHDRRRSMPARFSEAAADTGMDMSERRSEGGETSSNSGRSPATTSSVALNATTSRSEAIAESSSRPRTPTKNILRPRIQLKQGTPMDADTRKFLKKIAPITKYHSSVYEEELQQAAKRLPFYHVGEFVQVRWRRPSRWELPRETITWYPAVVVRMKANGRAVGVQFKDGDCETDLNVPVEHVRNGIQRDFTSLALLQREWEKPVRAGTERARVARRYVQPTQPKWKSCVNIAANSHGDPEASYAQEQFLKRLEEDRLRKARDEEDAIIERMLRGESASSATLKESDLSRNGSPRRGDVDKANVSGSVKDNLTASRHRIVVDHSQQRRPNRRSASADHGGSRGPVSQLERSGSSPSSGATLANDDVDAASALVVEHEIIQKILAYEAHLSKVKATVKAEAKAYKNAVIKEVKLHAFDRTTELLRAGRSKLVGLVIAIEKWHRLSGHALVFPAHPEYSPQSPGSGTPPPGVWDNPFKWNGRDAYDWLLHSLDFLSACKPLRHCYGPDYAWKSNPFSLACGVDARPQTPRRGTMISKIAGQDVQQTSKSEMELRALELGRLDEWLHRMRNSADWWPSIRPEFCNMEADEVTQLRLADKALAGTCLEQALK